MHSPLTNKVILADGSNHSVGRYGYKICKITPHHMAAVWTAEQCAQSFRNPGRNASANYCIGYDGTIVCSVDEVHRAWTSSNHANDCQAITIEVANSTGAPSWEVSDAAWNSLVRLCADICKRYGFRLNFDGTPNGSLTMHKMFAATSCPGPYLEPRMGQLAQEVNAILDGGAAPSKPKPTPAPSKPSSGKTVEQVAQEIVKGQGGWGNGNDRIARVQAAGLSYDAVQTRVNQILGVGSTQPSTPKYTVEQVAQEIVKGQGGWGNGDTRKQKVQSVGLSYDAVQSRVNQILGVGSAKPAGMSARQFALEVWQQGKHGSGADRQAAAQRLGVNYAEAQRLINILAAGGSI